MWEIEYYEKENGECPVDDFLNSLPKKQEAKALRAIDLLAEKGMALSSTVSSPIRGKIWELRIKFSSDIQRVFYFARKGTTQKFVLLHGFVKKTQKTPASEIDTAERYYNDYVRRFPAL